MKTKGLAVLIAVLCILLAGCTQDNLVKQTKEKADIPVKNGVFDVTMDQCIEILNKDIKKEGLPLIPTKYDSERENVLLSKNGQGVVSGDGENFTIYSAKITDTIEFQMLSFKRLNGGMPVMEVINTSEKKSKKGDGKLTRKYFEIICNNVEPRFDAENFFISFFENKHYELGQFYFWCGIMNSGDDKIRQYVVTTNTDLFSFYI